MRRPLVAGGGVLWFVGIACALLMVVPVATQEPGPRFSAWSQAVPVGEPVYSADLWDACPFIAKDDLNLYFRTSVLDPVSKKWTWDIVVSHRDSPLDPWGTPVNLGPNVNTGLYNEFCSFVTIDGHWLYFVANRPDGYQGVRAYGNQDIFVTHRKDADDPAGWEPPMNVGPYVNTSAAENGPSVFEDEATGKVIMYFTRIVSGKYKIFQTVLLDKDNPGPETLVPGLNVEGANDWHSFVRRRDGLEVIFASDRGGLAAADLFVATRPTISSAWSEPVNLGTLVNSTGTEARPSLSWDGTTLYFWTNREDGSIHVYTSKRMKITGKK
jgi:hypothetical protein